MALNYPKGLSIGSGFEAYLTADIVNATGDGTLLNINFDGIVSNIGNDYLAGSYTCPTNGYYLYTYQIAFNSPTQTSTRQFFSVFDGAPWNTRSIQEVNPGTGDYVINASQLIQCNAGDVMKILFSVFNAAAKDVTIYGNDPRSGSQVLATTLSVIQVGIL